MGEVLLAEPELMGVGGHDFGLEDVPRRALVPLRIGPDDLLHPHAALLRDEADIAEDDGLAVLEGPDIADAVEVPADFALDPQGELLFGVPKADEEGLWLDLFELLVDVVDEAVDLEGAVVNDLQLPVDVGMAMVVGIVEDELGTGDSYGPAGRFEVDGAAILGSGVVSRFGGHRDSDRDRRRRRDREPAKVAERHACLSRLVGEVPALEIARAGE